MMFLRNAWYVGAWAYEVTDGLMVRRMLNEDICMFRDPEGGVHAVHNTCPHRFAPLHKGKLIDGTVECPYHGLRFGADGVCVRNPHGDGQIPKRARLRVYPAIEKYKMVWVWMGDPALADENAIPEFSFMNDSSYVIVKDVLTGNGNYQLFTDNILDIGHAEFVHPGLGAPIFTLGKRPVRQEGNTVWSDLKWPNDPASPATDFILNLQGAKVDTDAPMRWDAPAAMLFDFKVSKPGQPVAPEGRHPSLHIFTPETQYSTHYFWAAAKHHSIGDDAHTEKMKAAISHAFADEDRPLIGGVQDVMGKNDLWDLNPIILPGDAHAVHARRVLAKLIACEQEANEKSREPYQSA